jgi:predicted transcriptional regulator
MRKANKEQATESVDAATLAAIDEGMRVAENGKRWTMEEAFEFARNRRKSWTITPSEKRTA